MLKNLKPTDSGIVLVSVLIISLIIISLSIAYLSINVGQVQTEESVARRIQEEELSLGAWSASYTDKYNKKATDGNISTISQTIDGRDFTYSVKSLPPSSSFPAGTTPFQIDVSTPTP